MFFWGAIFFQFSVFANDCHYEQCTVNQSMYNGVFQRLRQIYPGIRYNANWYENRPMAFAQGRSITVSGGFARKPGLTLGGLITVSCHEVGHALFGLHEGEADYFATNSCMKKYFQRDRNNESIARGFRNLRREIVQQCRFFPSGESNGICIRTSLSGFNAAEADRKRCVTRLDELRSSILNSGRRSYFIEEYYYRCLRMAPEVGTQRFQRSELLAVIEKASRLSNQPVSFTRKDQRRVRRVYRQHNSAQCRMDTLQAGALNQSKPKCWHP